MRPDIVSGKGNICARRTCAVLIVDIVESVRLIEEDEEETIQRWLGIVAHSRATILPPCGGRVVKSTGDGMLIEFEHAVAAVTAAFAIQHSSQRDNFGRPAS